MSGEPGARPEWFQRLRQSVWDRVGSVELTKAEADELAALIRTRQRVSLPRSPDADRPRDVVYPPGTLDAGRAQWTARDKLARLVTRAREIGYCSEPADAFPEALAEERALFEELAGLVEYRASMNDPTAFSIIDGDVDWSDWSPRQKLERLKGLCRRIGSFYQTNFCPQAEMDEEDALFEELAAMLEELEHLHGELSFPGDEI